ncbi:hybrid sensor histidine kinase/response regulator [Gayadomonas joobiniege]|uniref:hybrid sensor histidine kinase/response regulator n=1 Tax=Gayadomonas joobiniege TaxID=1234606 RepID=UPI00035E2FF4|nr:PAS domain-containing sensor histidine kinase [Gayadomonas joobiniege]
MQGLYSILNKIRLEQWAIVSFLICGFAILTFALIIHSIAVHYVSDAKKQQLAVQSELLLSQINQINQTELAALNVWTEQAIVSEFAKQLLLRTSNDQLVASEMDYLAVLIENGLRAKGRYQNNYIFSVEGELIWQAESGEADFFLNETERNLWLKQLRRGRSNFIYLSKNRLARFYIPVLYSVPVFQDGEIIAILSLEVEQSLSIKFLLDAVATHAEFVLYDETGNILLSDSGAWSRVNLQGLSLAGVANSGVSDQADDLVYASSWHPDSQLGVVAQYSQHQFDQDVQPIWRAILGLCATTLVVILGLIIAVQISRNRLNEKQQSLIRHQKQLTHVQALANIACVELDADNKIKWYGGFEFLGELTESGRQTPLGLFEKLNEVQKSEIRSALKQTRFTETAQECEIYFQTLVQFKCFNLRFFPQFDDTKFLSTLILINDISEHKRQHKEALQAEVDYRDLILQSAHDGIVSVDVNGRVTLCNIASQRMLNFDSGQLLNLKLYEFLDDIENNSEVTPPCLQAIKSRRTVAGLFWFRRDKGTLFPAECRVNPIIRDGQAVGAVYLFHDISEKLKLEVELREREQRYRRVIEGTADATFEWNMLDDSLHFSSRFWEMLKYPSAQTETKALTESSWQETVAVEHLPKVAYAIQTHLIKNQRFDVEFKANATNEQNVWLRVRGQAVREEGRFIYLSGTISDISNVKEAEAENRKLQEQLVHAQKMEAIGQLTGGIAHDFNNILASVLGYAELAQDCIEYNMPEKMDGYLNQIIQAGVKARDLIHKMMVFSRKDQHKVKPLSLDDTLSDIFTMVKPLLTSSIQTELALSSDVVVKTDAVQIQQILMNLMINARDAMQGRGHLTVVSYQEQVSQFQCTSCRKNFTGQMACIEVSDSGSGIDEARLQRIFDPYFTTKGLGKGTGMGLSIVHGMVHQLGGHLLVSSELGKGTSFKVYLPIATQVAQENINKLPKLTSVKAASAPMIYLVDDEPSVADFISEKLLLNQYQCRVFYSAQAVLDELSVDPQACALIISDQTMPSIDGVTLLQSARELNPKLKSIIMTGYSDLVDESSVQEFGIDGFIHKPIETSQLFHLIERLLKTTSSQS